MIGRKSCLAANPAKPLPCDSLVEVIYVEENRHSDIVSCSEVGFLNVHTGCLISPMVEYKGIFSNEHEPTGDVLVSWGNGAVFTLSGKKVDEFLNKICTTK